jgi:hypothetical protein
MSKFTFSRESIELSMKQAKTRAIRNFTFSREAIGQSIAKQEKKREKKRTFTFCKNIILQLIYENIYGSIVFFH